MFIEMQTLFHRYFGFPTPKKPQMMPTDFLKMRLNFLLEELRELTAASGFSFDEETKTFVSDSAIKPNAEEILDALVDLQVVLLGTADLMGFLNRMPESSLTFFEEAWRRVWVSNMSKQRCESSLESKRGFSIDLKKPVGWKAPDLTDLVKGFFGQCIDCKCDLQVPHGSQDDGKCDACSLANKPL